MKKQFRLCLTCHFSKKAKFLGTILNTFFQSFSLFSLESLYSFFSHLNMKNSSAQMYDIISIQINISELCPSVCTCITLQCFIALMVPDVLSSQCLSRPVAVSSKRTKVWANISYICVVSVSSKNNQFCRKNSKVSKWQNFHCFMESSKQG